ncbi:FkbM family methyltransferase [Pasteurellaceae bacterium LIM206]|nr:FkbM family methyltransferase [Pasteurellaceae bacterium LIM206]
MSTAQHSTAQHSTAQHSTAQQLYNLRWGLFKLIEGDLISEYAKYYGEWSEAEVAVFRLLLTPTDNIIEVGSNIGMHAVPLAKMVPHGKIFCFEPQRVIFQHLCCNLTLNRLTNAYAYHQGAGEYTEQLDIQSSNYKTPWNYGSFSLDKGFSTENHFTGDVHLENLEVVRLDDHIEINRLPHLKLLKIDAEGFDLQVLNGAKKLIEKHQPVIFIEVHFETMQVTLDYMERLGYQCYWLASNRFQENNYFNRPKTIDGIDINFLCYPKSAVNIPPFLHPVPKEITAEMSVPLICTK